MNAENINLLSEEIKIQRFKMKKTQDDCAKLLNISIPTYKNLEDNPNKLDLDQAILLFEFLNFDIENIFLKYILHIAI